MATPPQLVMWRGAPRVARRDTETKKDPEEAVGKRKLTAWVCTEKKETRFP